MELKPILEEDAMQEQTLLIEPNRIEMNVMRTVHLGSKLPFNSVLKLSIKTYQYIKRYTSKVLGTAYSCVCFI